MHMQEIQREYNDMQDFFANQIERQGLANRRKILTKSNKKNRSEAENNDSRGSSVYVEDSKEGCRQA